MAGDSTPGQIGTVLCPHCGGSIFFPFNGGPHTLICPQCKQVVSLEVVHDGIKWKAKLQEHIR